ncbi:hypothetical protein SH501x_001931 [Pirellulaceae bacterium SH501]
MGFSRNGVYLLVISHSGRGVYAIVDWELVARDAQLAYTENGIGIGIGPIDGESVDITEMNHDTGGIGAEHSRWFENFAVRIWYD